MSLMSKNQNNAKNIEMNLLEIPKAAVSLVSEFPNEYAGRIIKLALAALQPNHQDLWKPLEKLAAEKNIPKDQLYEVLSVYIRIIKLFIHSTDKDFLNTLAELGFTSEFIESLPFVNNRSELVNTFFAPHYDHFQNVSSIKWRIDISLLHSSLVSKTLPNVIFSIKLKNGKSYTIELSQKAFHAFRFNVALILKEMKSLKLNKVK